VRVIVASLESSSACTHEDTGTTASIPAARD